MDTAAEELQKWRPLEVMNVEDYRRMPFRVVTRTRIHASCAQVFATLEDAHAWPRWVRAIRSVEWTSDRPFGLGTTRTVTMHNGVVMDERFIVWEPDCAMGFTVVQATVSGVRRFGERYDLASDKDGCVLRWTFVVDAKAWWMRMLLRLSWLLFYVALHRVLRGLKREVERRSRALSQDS